MWVRPEAGAPAPVESTRGIEAEKEGAEDAPRLNTVIRLIATLGGFLGRKSDGEPGVKTLWIGLQRLTDFAAGL